MSIYATIDGVIELGYGLDPDFVIARLEEFAQECDPEVMFRDDETYKVYFGGYQRYNDDETYAFLQEIAPYTVGSEITYISDENSFWRHFYIERRKEWYEQNGRIEYENDGKSVSFLMSFDCHPGINAVPEGKRDAGHKGADAR